MENPHHQTGNHHQAAMAEKIILQDRKSQDQEIP
jgi:hypothetical protein